METASYYNKFKLVKIKLQIIDVFASQILNFQPLLLA